MPAFIPTNRVSKKSDTETLRWSVRSDGNSGYVFVNNYQRLQPMPAKSNVKFTVNLPNGVGGMPQFPITIPADSFFFWPFNMDLSGIHLISATAQPICKAQKGDTTTYYFVETPGVDADFAIAGENIGGKAIIYKKVKTGRKPALKFSPETGGKVEIVLLNEADSLKLTKNDAGKVIFEEPVKTTAQPAKAKLLREAGPAREIPLVTKSQIAAAPTNDDFTNAAVWQIKLPAKIDLAKNPLLRIQYLGDVARLTLNGKLIADNFYAGRPFDLGLKRYGQEIFTGDLRLEILPLRKDASVYIEPKNRSDFGTNSTLLKLQSVEIVQ